CLPLRCLHLMSFFSVYIAHLSAIFFFFNDTTSSVIYTLSLHDALPIFCPWRGASPGRRCRAGAAARLRCDAPRAPGPALFSIEGDRKSTRLNSSHLVISYAVFCLKKKILPLHELERTTADLFGGIVGGS